jgi:multidrug efflux pump subunit AcrB
MCRGVFIPLLFMGGIIGRLFREFAVTISVAVIASAVISLTLTPVMCSLFLGREGLHPKGRFNRGCERTFQAALRAYDRGLNFVFRHQLSALLATLLLMAATGYLYVKMPKGFFPEQDTGWHYSAGAMATTTLGHRTRISLPAAVDDVRGSAI